MAEREVRYDDIKKIRQKEEKKVEQIPLKGEVLDSKKSLGGKFKEAFGLTDGQTVKDYILFDILVPACKNTIMDMVNGGLSTLFTGAPKSQNIFRDRGRSYVAYDTYASSVRPPMVYGHQQDIVPPMLFRDRHDAETVLNRMCDIIEDFGVVSVLDFCDLIGKTPDYTANHYGWQTLRDAYIDAVRGGYMIHFPAARPLN